MEMSSRFTQRLLQPPEKAYPVLIDKEALWPPEPALIIWFHVSSVEHCSSLSKVQAIHAFNYLTIHQVVEVYFHSFLPLTLDAVEWSASGVD
jgi:hypothetical protein